MIHLFRFLFSFLFSLISSFCSPLFPFLPSFLPSFLPFFPPSVPFLLPSFNFLCQWSYQMSSTEDTVITDIIPILVMGGPQNSPSVFFVKWVFWGPRWDIWETVKNSQKELFVFFHIPFHASFVTPVAYLSSYKTTFWGAYFLYQAWGFMIYT